MVNTPNHNYNIPNEGTTNWHIPLNENFEQLDTDIEIRGLEEDKSDHEPQVGTKYEATDSGAVYHGDGDKWVLTDRIVDHISARQIQTNGPRIVSPSIDGGYDSLQSAIDDAAEGGSSTIWLSENIEENVVIPKDDEVNWYRRGGITIKGVSEPYTKITDKKEDGETPVITGTDSNAQLHHFTLKNIHIDGSSSSGPAMRFGPSVPFLTLINCRTNMPNVISKPFFGSFERCYFENQATFVEVSRGPAGGPVTTDTPMIVSAGNLLRIDRCTFRSSTGETNWALLWLCQINNLELTQPEFKVKNSQYDESTDHAVASCLIDGACGDIHMDSPYCEGLMDTHYRTARTPLTETGSPRAIFMENARGQHYTIDQKVAGIYIKTDGAEDKHLVTNASASPDSYFKTPPNTLVTLSGSRTEVAPKILEGSYPQDTVNTPALPSSTGEANAVRNPNPMDCLVYHNGKGAEINLNFGTLYGSPAYVPNNREISFSGQVPTNWTWVGIPIR